MHWKVIGMQPLKLLIADDDAVLRLDLRTMLEEIGHLIVGEADNGETALYLSRQLKPDLVILDVKMPRLNGLEAAEAINQDRIAPVLMLTAYCDAPMIEQANRAGVLAYLVKPYRAQELQAAIAIAQARYREMTALEGALKGAQEQVEANRIIGKAKKVLMNRHCLSDQEAFRRLQAQALTSSRTLREISEAILLADEISMPMQDSSQRR